VEVAENEEWAKAQYSVTPCFAVPSEIHVVQ
jgi:hypothetical protein